MLLVNETLNGRYRIIRQLGRGGMGAVYEAFDNVFDTTVALKEIMIDMAKVPNPQQQELIRRAFEREAKLLAKIKHEVVPHVRDYFYDTNRQFLVMELVEGKDLGELLEERQSPFPLEDVLRWIEQLLDALDYLHTQSPPIFHRDLKPQNLKLTPRGRIKLLDFGIAKGGTEVQNSTTINNQTFIAATLNYSPIEQIFRVLDPVFREVLTQRFEQRIERVAQQNADARSDLYALGATAFHLLTGQLPVDALKRMMEIWSGRPDPLPNPLALNTAIPPEVAGVLLKAMQIDHDERYGSALEMQQALHKALGAVQNRESAQKPAASQSQQQTLVMEKEHLQKQLEAQRLEHARLMQQRQSTQSEQQISQQRGADQQLSEQTIEASDFGYGQSAGGSTGSQPPTTTGGTPFQPGGGDPYRTGGGAGYQTGGQVAPPTEHFPFAGASTGGAGRQNNPVSTGGFGIPDQTVQTGGAAFTPAPVGPTPSPAPKKSRRKILWLLPVAALLFLMLGGAVLGFVLWQNFRTEEAAATPTPTPPVSTPTPKATPEPTVEPTPAEVNSTRPSLEPTATPASKPQVEVKPDVQQQKTPRPQPTKPKPKPTRTITADDLINDA